jgi:hypothetical protein
MFRRRSDSASCFTLFAFSTFRFIPTTWTPAYLSGKSGFKRPRLDRLSPNAPWLGSVAADSLYAKKIVAAVVQALLHKRRSELQQQQQKRAELQQELLEEEGRQVAPVFAPKVYVRFPVS